MSWPSGRSRRGRWPLSARQSRSGPRPRSTGPGATKTNTRTLRTLYVTAQTWQIDASRRQRQSDPLSYAAYASLRHRNVRCPVDEIPIPTVSRQVARMQPGHDRRLIRPTLCVDLVACMWHDTVKSATHHRETVETDTTVGKSKGLNEQGQCTHLLSESSIPEKAQQVASCLYTPQATTR
eukprot:SAG25_NODE_305_length_10124_cov_16.774464_16_plen_180_part_00